MFNIQEIAAQSYSQSYICNTPEPEPVDTPQSPDPYEDQFLNMAKELERVKTEKEALKKQIQDLQSKIRDTPWYKAYYGPQNEDLGQLQNENSALKSEVVTLRKLYTDSQWRISWYLKQKSQFLKCKGCSELASFELSCGCLTCRKCFNKCPPLWTDDAVSCPVCESNVTRFVALDSV